MADHPQLWVVAGPNGAGKTTLTGGRISSRIPVVNPDTIAASLGDHNDRLVQLAAGRRAIAERSLLLQQRHSFAIETTLSGKSTLNFMQRAKTANYKVTLLFIGLSDVSLSLQRVADRFEQGGHRVPTADIQRRYSEAIENLPKAIGIADRSFIVDNSGLRRRLLLTIDEGRERFRSSDLPDWLKNSIPFHGADLSDLIFAGSSARINQGR
jgi:predicted ABC-type ATPase